MTRRLFALRSLPPLAAWALRQWHGGEFEHWTRLTLANRLARITEPRLRTLLGTRWADHGAPPDSAPFLEHALVTNSYKDGACYPAGGPGQFARTLLPVIEAAGGEVRCNADVKRIEVDMTQVNQHGTGAT